ncbi:MAG: 1-acyl-sn-glycerol-3-phosphate acyltransferase [Elusimicrobia bacterium]|nr:1-acyl-sn-glycerol-3-phosphate acyltransferase [Elusimicrobiota bacterium]MBD3412375.1 1-acyl-sn-glycerol-3-phosphate acyltransferase [Elusimicrobiota bacterium]
MIITGIRWVLYRTGWIFFRTVFRLFWRIRIIGTTNIPRSGGVIIASNHLSNADPPVIGSSINREVYFIAKEELFHNSIIGMVLRAVNGFPVKRGVQDISALRKAQDALVNEKVLLMFPEGHRNPHGKTIKPKPGVAMLAARTQVPVVPALIRNTDRLSRLKKISVVFGSPLYYDSTGMKDNTHYQAFTLRIMNAIRTLK